jgi:tetratricopeptide (TPR) repeat protein
MSISDLIKNAAAVVKRASDAYNASDFNQTVAVGQEALALLHGVNDEEAYRLVDKAYERLVMVYQRTGNHAAFREVLAQWQAATRREEGRILTCIYQSRLEGNLGNYEQAARLAEQAIRDAQAGNYRFEMGMAKRVRADLMWKLGHPEQALILGQEAIALLEQVGEMEQRAAAHVTVAAAHHMMGHFYKAVQNLQRCARLVEQLGRRFELAIVYSNLGETYAELYAMDKALEAHQKALELVGMERAHPDLIRNLGVDLASVGRVEEGLQHLQSALVRARQFNDPDMIAQALNSLAEQEIKADHLDQAESYANEQLDIAKRVDSLRHRIQALMLLGAIAQHRGDIMQAQVHFHDSSMLAQRSADSHALWQIHAALHNLLRNTMPQMAEIHRRIAAEMMAHILGGIEDEALRETFRNAEPVRSVLGSA